MKGSRLSAMSKVRKTFKYRGINIEMEVDEDDLKETEPRNNFQEENIMLITDEETYKRMKEKKTMERIRIDKLKSLLISVQKQAFFRTMDKTARNLQKRSNMYREMAKHRYSNKEDKLKYGTLHTLFWELSCSLLEAAHEEEYELFSDMVEKLEEEFGRFEHEQI